MNPNKLNFIDLFKNLYIINRHVKSDLKGGQREEFIRQRQPQRDDRPVHAEHWTEHAHRRGKDREDIGDIRWLKV